jgi:hypothetical protein
MSERKKVYFTFGRMNPVTIGHEFMVNELIKRARNNGANAVVGISMSQDPIKNPLSPSEKLELVKKAFGGKNLNGIYQAQYIMNLTNQLRKKYGKNANFTIVVGKNRKGNFIDKGFNIIGNIAVPRTAGNISATKVRNAALRGNSEFVSRSIPAIILGNTKKLIETIRSRMTQELVNKYLNDQKEKRKAAAAAAKKKKAEAAAAANNNPPPPTKTRKRTRVTSS